MERESVLEIEFIPIWNNNFVWKITKQNEDILKIGKFVDNDLNIFSYNRVDYDKDHNILYIKGDYTDNDYKLGIYDFCTLEEKKLIEEKVGLLNEKYAIKSLWRAEREKGYYYINDELYIKEDKDYRAFEDDRRYRNKNYFETEELAEEFRDKIKEVLKNNR